ncbi:SDR family NAD(P)-dependent oxidoreductase [Nocardioides sp. URHA0020]|uniref:SDR family NAD(P)-dependent oxidoreductase n=1 Tax=Nocardioides sp. URHA0020 TaxID=1380392 RepID=UPI000A573EC3|nr:SDR family oxidoreductase [Nocardioides sp. URHA0020]
MVFGGASGIGAAIATRFTVEGWRVEVADLPTVDVTDEATVATFLDGVLAAHGRLDAVVNSAGVSTLGNVVDLDVAEWRRVVDVCLTGGFVVIKQAGRRLTAGGSIVSLSSLNARQPGAGLAPYCAAKAGLSMLTEVAALELGPSGIRVNAIAPGLIVTPLTQPAMDIAGIEDDYLENTPLGRAGTPDEIAEAAVYLTNAQWVTGEVLDINGGAHLKRYPDLNKHVLAAFG